MGIKRRGGTSPLGIAVLLLGAGAMVFAQSGQPGVRSGSVAGQLTDLRSEPLANTHMLLRNEATGAETQTTTGRKGGFRFAALPPGTYSLEADDPQRGVGHLDGIVVSDGHEARVQAAIALRPALVVTLADTARPATNTARLPATGTPPAAASPPVAASTSAAEQALALANFLLLTTPPRHTEPSLFSIQITATMTRRLLLAKRLGGLPAVAALAQPATPASAVLATAPGRTQVPATLVAAVRQDEPGLDTSSMTLTAEEVQALPVSGRNWQDFLPNANTAAGEETPAPLDTRDGRGTMVDGAGTGSAFGGGGTYSRATTGQAGAEPANMGQAWGGGHNLPISESAIQQVQVENRGDGGGGRISIETRQGSSTLHGQGFLYDRENAWGARNPFTRWTKETAPATTTTTPVFTAQPYTPPDHDIAWGFGVGGPARRGKGSREGSLVWFASVDGRQRNDPALSTVRNPDLFFAQPSNDQMQVLSARLGLSSMNPVAEGLAAYSRMLETLNGLLGPAPRTSSQWSGFARLDWHMTERQSLALEGNAATSDAPGGGLRRVEENFGTHSLGSTRASQVWLLGRWQTFVTANLLAVTQVSGGRSLASARPETPTAFEQTLNQNIWGQLPQIIVDSRYGFSMGNPSRFGRGSYPDERKLHVQQSLDWAHGNLLVKTGFSADHSSDATSLLHNQTGTYHYTSVENFASDALAFAAFGIAGQLNPFNQHNCDQTGRVWRDANGTLRGLGYLPCYSYYTQMMGPASWHVSSNDWAGYATAQWQPNKSIVLSAGLRWELEQLPPPIASVANPDPALTQGLPNLGNQWGPRVSLALGNHKNHWPMLRLGYGLYYGRTRNATLLTALTQTGSAKGDLSFFLRPTDNLHAGGAPPFPYVFAGEPLNIVKPGAVEFAPKFRNPEVHQAIVSVEETLPSRIRLTASAAVSLGRRLPIATDANIDPAVNPGTITYAVVDGSGKGPIKAQQITVPFYAAWPGSTGTSGRLHANYQQIAEITSKANSTYEAALVSLDRTARRGLGLHLHYAYAHAMDWNPNEGTSVSGSDVLDPGNFKLEYGTGNLDIRHSVSAIFTLEPPWKLHNMAGQLANGWMLSGIGQYHSGRPFTLHTSGSIPEEFKQATGAAIIGLAPGMNGSGGDDRVYGVGRNTYRYPATWKADVRLSKRFDLGAERQLELLAESFNLFNHQNVTQLETTGYYIRSGSPSGGLPTLNFLTGLKANTTAFGQPLSINGTNYYRERQIELGLRMHF